MQGRLFYSIPGNLAVVNPKVPSSLADNELSIMTCRTEISFERKTAAVGKSKVHLHLKCCFLAHSRGLEVISETKELIADNLAVGARSL